MLDVSRCKWVQYSKFVGVEIIVLVSFDLCSFGSGLIDMACKILFNDPNIGVSPRLRGA
jgi:hypothetical protein